MSKKDPKLPLLFNENKTRRNSKTDVITQIKYFGKFLKEHTFFAQAF